MYVVSYCGIPTAFVGESPCPLFQNDKIVQQPADFLQLTENYVKGAESFIKTNASMLASQCTTGTEFCSLTSCSPAPIIALHSSFYITIQTRRHHSFCIWLSSTPIIRNLPARLSPTPVCEASLGMLSMNWTGLWDKYSNLLKTLG